MRKKVRACHGCVLVVKDFADCVEGKSQVKTLVHVLICVFVFSNLEFGLQRILFGPLESPNCSVQVM